MQIQVNGERRELRDESRLSDLLKELSLAPERVAVELNHQVVRRNEWPNTILKEGDRVEIVHFVGGGFSSGRDLERFDSDQRTPLDS
jgi:sulfur carrier protein